jgi:AraC-like DNA-binding protein
MDARSAPPSALPPQRAALPVRGFESRAAIEDYLDRLNRSSPVAQRAIAKWGRGAQHLRVAAVPLAPLGRADENFLGEAQTTFALDVRAQRAAATTAPLTVGLLLAGTMRVTLADGEHLVQAGEGVLVDPAELERTQFAPHSHFVEFALPRQQLLRLGAELGPGAAGVARWAPVLPAPLAQRLRVMALQTAEVLRAGRPEAGTRMMFERWLEMIALTLLHEHAVAAPAQPAPGAAGAAMGAGPAPRSVGRALDFIDAHAQADILLADIAAAACVSASTLLRLFNTHLGQTPAAFLRQVRLDRARAELRRGGAASVRELAQRWGFQSAAKFSQAYLRRFGERPQLGR